MKGLIGRALGWWPLEWPLRNWESRVLVVLILAAMIAPLSKKEGIGHEKS